MHEMSYVTTKTTLSNIITEETGNFQTVHISVGIFWTQTVFKDLSIVPFSLVIAVSPKKVNNDLGET